MFTALHHEFWRDEVRSLSVIRAAQSPLELIRLIGDGGHPALWYFLLYGAHAVAHTRLVLRVVPAGRARRSRVCSWTPADLRRLDSTTEYVTEFSGAPSDENYRLFRVHSAGHCRLDNAPRPTR